MTAMSVGDALALAQRHQAAGAIDRAEHIYRQIFTFDPTERESFGALLRLGRSGFVEEVLRKTIAVKPTAALHNALGVLLGLTGRPQLAVAEFEAAIALQPDLGQAHSNLGNALHSLNRLEDSLNAHRRALELAPQLSQAHSNYGNALQSVGRVDEAIAQFHHAINLLPSDAHVYLNLGNALNKLERFDESIAAFSRAVALQPNFVDAHTNMGNVYRDTGRIGLAVAAYQQALAWHPQHPWVRWNLALVRLLQGDLAQGFPDYEFRWQTEECRGHQRHQDHPQWDGSDLNGRRILLYAEQGFGDAIQFARYVPMVAARGGRVIVQCQTLLKRLFKSLSGAEEILGPQDETEFDLQCPLMTLPLLFGTTLQTIPQAVPYLHVDDAAQWQERVATVGDGLKVGLAWAGNPRHHNDSNRSIPFSKLTPLLEMPNVNFFNLQKGPAAEQAAGSGLTDWTSELDDFADSAALISALDLVISVDTAPAHLAGALGKPVWVLLPFAPDWRWLLHRDDNPWYPTAQLFRQTRIGDWNEPIDSLMAKLRQLAKKP